MTKQRAWEVIRDEFKQEVHSIQITDHFGLSRMSQLAVCLGLCDCIAYLFAKRQIGCIVREEMEMVIDSAMESRSIEDAVVFGKYLFDKWDKQSRVNFCQQQIDLLEKENEKVQADVGQGNVDLHSGLLQSQDAPQDTNLVQVQNSRPDNQ